MSKLIATKHRLRPDTLRMWHPCEGELKGMVDNVEDFGGIVELALRYLWAYSKEHPQKVQKVCEAAQCDSMDKLMRVGMGVDSQTAMGRWKKTAFT